MRLPAHLDDERVADVAGNLIAFALVRDERRVGGFLRFPCHIACACCIGKSSSTGNFTSNSFHVHVLDLIWSSSGFGHFARLYK